MVRLAPEPPSVMLASGIKVSSLLVAVTVSDSGAVSTSSIVKAMAPVAVSSSVDWLSMGLIVGASLSVVTVIANEV